MMKTKTAAEASPVEIVSELMAPWARCYRKGNIKPGAIAVTDEQFDALCDLSSMSTDLINAFRALVNSYDAPHRFTLYDAGLFDAITACRAALDKLEGKQ